MIRTRFAPSPTGYMHIGNLRTALYAFLIARKDHGTLILRIEDTDQARNVPEAVAAIYKGLKLAGIEYDEGPDKDGGYGPYVQSERLPLYKQYADDLVTKGAAYYCFCKKEDKVEEEDDLPKLINRRDPCRMITVKDANQRAGRGEEHVIRQRIPEEGSSTFHDHVYGDITITHDSLDDQVLLKSDGYPTYNFANVVDDHLMAVTHVVRGQEYLSSTPKYNLLYEAFGWEEPEYIHLPHIIKESGEKFSKRNGDPSFEDLVNLGYLPEAIVNYVALLGWSPGNDQEFFTMPSLIDAFNMDRINKSSAAFSFDKLIWLNGEHIRALSEEEFNKLALPYYPESIQHLDLLRISQLIHIRVERLTDIPQMVAFLGNLPEYDNNLFENQKSKSSLDSSLQVLKSVLPVLESVSQWDNETLFGVLKQYGNENSLKVGSVMWPIRSALSGLPNTPGGATELAVVLGREESLKRIEAGLKKLETA
ncbi:MAG: glutamate--tRNA ligase [Anaerolineaceae bacterium]|nr:glutamate--tRNA ligase [Anaerolineaceae bacterium]